MRRLGVRGGQEGVYEGGCGGEGMRACWRGWGVDVWVVGVSVSLGEGLKGGGCGDWTYRGGNRGMR